MARLLIIEDEAELLHALEQLFVHDGHDVLTAIDGEQGLRRFREGRVDLVIVDILLPKLDGFAVCKAIRRGSDVPIIVTTALDDEGHQLQGFSLLADDYVTKPYSLSVMRERVRAVLRRCAALRMQPPRPPPNRRLRPGRRAGRLHPQRSAAPGLPPGACWDSATSSWTRRRTRCCSAAMSWR